MTWDGHLRALPGNWRNLRAAILLRDGYQCQINGHGCWGQATEVDHIQPDSNHDPANLRAVCHYCHGKKSSREGHATRRRSDDDHDGFAASAATSLHVVARTRAGP